MCEIAEISVNRLYQKYVHMSGTVHLKAVESIEDLFKAAEGRLTPRASAHAIRI